MNDDFLGNEFRIALQNALVARAHELDSAGRPFQRHHVFNDIMRGVGSEHFSLLEWSAEAMDFSSCV